MQKPITSAETINYWAYHAADLNAIRNIFGECICRTIEKSPRRIREAKCQTLQTTECVGMKLPRQNYQDAIILLEVCVAEDLIKTLFPSACERVLSLASVYSSEDCAQKNMPVVITPEHQKDLSSEYARKSKIIQQDYVDMLTCKNQKTAHFISFKRHLFRRFLQSSVLV
jgi:hypothetical protein